MDDTHAGGSAGMPGATGLEQALAAPADPRSDPAPGERSGLSSRIAHEILDDLAVDDGGPGAASARAVETDDPASAVGDDPAHPLHGSFAAEFEQS
ncbi:MULTISPECIES: hypothetical protein [unclassified Rathayibacter]|uniref:hypothetical protein n=1 Tax=unclassified Rathayibacter TaxID=2609250 RepID=UPI00188B86CE|nr:MULTISPECIES: hypothetical protein [unclassified Rathayibacter]MBF4461393.1 hypothetical protein [Rathayibacter sp. VKM Ac-2879]MBF4502804.1 hypothetical protein [Rathayibacter sp. VKM Ac-2878]